MLNTNLLKSIMYFFLRNQLRKIVSIKNVFADDIHYYLLYTYIYIRQNQGARFLSRFQMDYTEFECNTLDF